MRRYRDWEEEDFEEEAREMGERLREDADKIGINVKDKFNEMSERMKHASNKARDDLYENPMKYVMIAGFVGFLIGLKMGMKSR